MADTLLQRWSGAAPRLIRLRDPENPEAALAASPSRIVSPAMIGIASGIVASFCWATAFAFAKQGIENGMAPADLALHRFVWSGALLLPFLARKGLSDLGGVGWGRGIVLMLLAGPLQAFLAYFGFSIVPLGHGTVIQPATATVMGALLSAWILREHLSITRIAGIIVIVIGLSLFGAEALATIGTHGAGGDLLFVGAGTLWALFSVALRRWSVNGMHAMAVVTVLSLLIIAPLHGLVFGYQSMIAAGWTQNLIQAFVQGFLGGAVPIYLYARSVSILGASRASMFIALVPVFSVALGIVLIGEIPTLTRLIGLAIVVIGFRFAMKQ
jgi:drug/metabolite transporter (DMT)-like permease